MRPAPPGLRIDRGAVALDAGEHQAARAHPGQARIVERRQRGRPAGGLGPHARHVAGAAKEVGVFVGDDDIAHDRRGSPKRTLFEGDAQAAHGND